MNGSAPSTVLPAPPSTDLARAKRDAKHLRKALHTGDPQAQARFRAVFEDGKPGTHRNPGNATHADCLHVIAREAGAPSWPRLKLAVETALISHAQRVHQLTRSVLNGNLHLVERLLELDPQLPHAHFGLLLAFARKQEALAALAKEPALATTPIEHRWPIHFLAFSCIHRRDAGVHADQIALLEALLAAGADVNQGFLCRRMRAKAATCSRRFTVR